MDHVTFHDLYEAYPHYHINVKYEQELLLAHDIIIFQHPFYWYSSPAIIKEWMDLVLEYGFAYGHNGTSLHGKIMMNAISTGGPEGAYCKEGFNRFTMRQLLAPFDQTAVLCGMAYLAPFVLHQSLLYTNADELGPQIKAYKAMIIQLQQGKLDLKTAAVSCKINDLVKAL